MSAPSKNQRAGAKQKPRVHRCPAGHARANVYVVGRGMTLQCECDGYVPIDMSQPYQSRPPKLKTTGQARVWFEQPRAL
jgi:hypothetical protein